MLVLGRKSGDAIVIGESHCLTVGTVQGGTVAFALTSTSGKFQAFQLKVGQVFRLSLVDDDVDIILVKIHCAKRIRIGFEAPKCIKIMRKEIIDG